MKKPKRYKNKDYIEFIKGMLCCISGNMGQMVDPHHAKSVGSGGSDLTCVPLRHDLHQECHSLGRDTFQRKYNIDFNEIQIQLLQNWIEKGIYD